MALDPYYYYLDGKRKENRWASVTPFILVGLLLLIMAIDGYLSYKVYVAPVRRTVIPYTKPKPPTTPQDITDLMEKISPTRPILDPESADGKKVKP